VGVSTTKGFARELQGRAARALKRSDFATLGAHPTATRGGHGIGVAVIDSGIEPELDFNNRITAFYDFSNGDIRAATPHDDYGHGTHVAGLIGSEFVGVAPHSRLIGLKVLDSRGRGTTDNVVRAIEFALNVGHQSLDLLGRHRGAEWWRHFARSQLVQNSLPVVAVGFERFRLRQVSNAQSGGRLAVVVALRARVEQDGLHDAFERCRPPGR
jgi:hypothetical protein